MICFQEPAEPSFFETLGETLQALGWIDKTALGVLLVFFVLGLFKGLIWQVSRIGILVAAYIVAGRFGRDVAGLMSSTPPERMAADAMATQEVAPGETTLYLAYCLLFIAVLVVLSLLAMLIKKLADKAGLGFFDRLGGGVLGVATGACVVLFGVFVVHMFFPDSQLAEAAEDSHSLRFSQQAIDFLGAAVNDDLRSVLALQPLEGPLLIDGVAPVDPDLLPRMPEPLPLPPDIQGGDPGPAGGDDGVRRGNR
ncbi:MAG: CvpA family protein [Planctomycetota bacterium]